MKLRKKVLVEVCIILTVIVILITVGIILIINKHQKELALQFPDKNGEDKSLCLITDDLILQHTEEYRAIKYHFETKGGEKSSSGIIGHFSDCDREYVEVRAGMLSGIYVCNAYIGSGEQVTYAIESTVTSGNLRIIITDGNNVILHDVPIDSTETISFTADKDKTYYVKLVAESAKLEVKVNRNG